MGINMKEKEIIRQSYLDIRNQIPRAEIEDRSARISRNIITSELFMKADKIYSYFPIGSEVDLRGLMQLCWDVGKRVAIPRILGKEMAFFEINDFDHLEDGPLGTKQPPDSGAPTFWEHALVLCPGVAFDNRGYRLGYGAGYYDKFLAREPEHITIGVAYGSQIGADLPVEAHDMPLDYIVTDRELFQIGTK